MSEFDKLFDACNLCGQSFAAHGNDESATCPIKVVGLYGQIGELDIIDTIAKLEAWLIECNEVTVIDSVQQGVVEAAAELKLYAHIFEPIGIEAGTYLVHGIGGANWLDGRKTGCTVCGTYDCRQFTIEVTPATTPFDLMLAVEAWALVEANGFDGHHVYFEGLDIDIEARLLKFGMGS